MSNPHFIERKACPACGSVELALLFRCAYTEPPIRTLLEKRYAPRGMVEFDLLEGAEYALIECRSCSLICQRDIPDEYLAAIAYERWIDPDRAWDHRARSVIRAKGRYALEVMAILDFLRRKPEDLSFLDFGMGWGFWLEMAEAFGVDAFGLEPAGSRTERAAEVGLRVIDLDRARTMRFDFINTEQVFEHLPDPYETAVELAGLLADGGILKISVPNGMRVKRRLKKDLWLSDRNVMKDVFPLQHINAFNHRALVRLGERAGLEGLAVPARLRYRYMPTWERAGRLMKSTIGAHYRALRGQTTALWFQRRGDGRAPSAATEPRANPRRRETVAKHAPSKGRE